MKRENRMSNKQIQRAEIAELDQAIDGLLECLEA